MSTVFSTQYYLGTPPTIYSDNAKMTPKRGNRTKNFATPYEPQARSVTDVHTTF